MKSYGIAMVAGTLAMDGNASSNLSGSFTGSFSGSTTDEFMLLVLLVDPMKVMEPY